ncbi:MAG: hypothetical protein LBP55_07510 [Candidatus Adiutrix sp.]|jgi:hypothetical protein|nr:hypothetical protein [Candidatus Adiutrix sp.]
MKMKEVSRRSVFVLGQMIALSLLLLSAVPGLADDARDSFLSSVGQYRVSTEIGGLGRQSFTFRDFLDGAVFWVNTTGGRPCGIEGPEAMVLMSDVHSYVYYYVDGNGGIFVIIKKNDPGKQDIEILQLSFGADWEEQTVHLRRISSDAALEGAFRPVPDERARAVSLFNATKYNLSTKR